MFKKQENFPQLWKAARKKISSKAKPATQSAVSDDLLWKVEESGFSSDAVWALVFSLELSMVMFKPCLNTAHFVLFNECISGMSGTGTFGGWWSQMDTGEGCGGFEEDELSDYLLISQNWFWFPGNGTVLGSDDLVPSRPMTRSNPIITPTTLFTFRAGSFHQLRQGAFALGKAVLSAPDYFLAIHISGNKLQ